MKRGSRGYLDILVDLMCSRGVLTKHCYLTIVTNTYSAKDLKEYDKLNSRIRWSCKVLYL